MAQLEELLGLETYKEVESFSSSVPIVCSKSADLVLFQTPPNFDCALLTDIDIDLDDTELQVFQFEKQSIGILVCDQEFTSYVSQQVIPLLNVKGNLTMMKPFVKIIKVVKYQEMPEINKHSIIRTVPISYQQTKKKIRKAK